MDKLETPDFETVLSDALQLSPRERIAMIEALAASFKEKIESDDPMTEAEILELMQVEPLSPAEIVAQGLTGVWNDIEDGASWVNVQKQKRKDRRKW